jgi:triacylglycerol esterase/lipase EstA (alpha/beta hydrolase family)
MFGTSRHFSAMRNLVIIDAQRTSIKPHQARFMNTTPSRIGVNRRSGWRNSAICRKSSRYILSRLKPGRDKMADLYVLVHGAWHTGAEMEAVAQHLRKDGHQVHCPTIAGNNAGDDRSKVGLEEAIASITNYIESKGLHDVRLVGHSYGGMIISGIADRLADTGSSGWSISMRLFRSTANASTTWSRPTISGCSMPSPARTTMP